MNGETYQPHEFPVRFMLLFSEAFTARLLLAASLTDPATRANMQHLTVIFLKERPNTLHFLINTLLLFLGGEVAFLFLSSFLRK